MTRHNGKRILSALCTLLPCSVFAKSGGVNYSWGADALASMHDYVVTMMLYVQYIIYAVAGGFAVIAARTESPSIYSRWSEPAFSSSVRQ